MNENDAGATPLLKSIPHVMAGCGTARAGKVPESPSATPILPHLTLGLGPFMHDDLT